MRAAVIAFPGSNCEHDVTRALTEVMGKKPHILRHDDSTPPAADLYVLPGGFSFGDYLRAGALAARTPVMNHVAKQAQKGAYLLGICNGFQILLERGLLPGSLVTNSHLRFRCRMQPLRITTNSCAFTRHFTKDIIHFPVAHQTGCYHAPHDVLEKLKDHDQIALRYHGDNPNGSSDGIAALVSRNKRICGLMPHPERAIHDIHESQDGRVFFEGLLNDLS